MNGEFFYNLNVGRDFLFMIRNLDLVKENSDKVDY